MTTFDASAIHKGATVYTSDGTAIGQVHAVYSQEFVVEETHLLRHTLRSFHYDAVTQATTERIDVSFDKAALSDNWNTVTFDDEKLRHQHVIQIGIRPTMKVPYYDEVQTTTGGPPTGETEIEGQ